jgi:DNA polymerase-3 subunit epsilon
MGLRTQTQWRRERRRVLTGVLPRGAIPTRERGSWYWLYALEQTQAMREAPPAQRAALARGRRTHRTCIRCGREYEGPAALTLRRVCYTCIADVKARRAQARDAAARAEATNWACALLEATDWVVVDTETTDLEAPEIVEIAVLAPDGAVLLETRVRPLTPVSDGARRVHGIGDDDLARAPTWLEIYPRFCALTEGKRLLAYNAGFDADAVATTCQLHQQPPLQRDWLDLMGPFAAWVGEWSSYHRGYRFQPLPFGGHSAREDCLAALDVLAWMAGQPRHPTEPGASLAQPADTFESPPADAEWPTGSGDRPGEE